MTKLIVAFRNFENVPINLLYKDSVRNLHRTHYANIRKDFDGCSGRLLYEP